MNRVVEMADSCAVSRSSSMHNRNRLEADGGHVLSVVSAILDDLIQRQHTFFLYRVVTLVANTPFLTLLVIRWFNTV